jgi:serine/threonine protein kinase
VTDSLNQHPDFEIVRRIAVGGMGEVLLARYVGDPGKGITPGLVALKRTIEDHSDKEHQDRMLLEEGRIAYRLRHENLVETYFLDTRYGHTILAMEYLIGRSMAQVLGNAKKSQQNVPFGIALNILRQAACGLHFAHTLSDGKTHLGLVHRDISPANILVAFDGRVKVIDFGVAKADDSEIRTSTGILKGKIGYMAPEHALGETLDARADLWSLGVFFWETLVANRLFANQNPAATLHQIVRGEVSAPSTQRPDIPQSLDALCLRMLTREKQKRISSASDLVMMIDAVAEQEVPLMDVNAFMLERFPAEAQTAREEGETIAKTSQPLPQGLQEGRVITEEEVEAATIVADRSELLELARSIASQASPPVSVKARPDEPKTLTEDNLPTAFQVAEVLHPPVRKDATNAADLEKTQLTNPDPLAAQAQKIARVGAPQQSHGSNPNNSILPAEANRTPPLSAPQAGPSVSAPPKAPDPISGAGKELAEAQTRAAPNKENAIAAQGQSLQGQSLGQSLQGQSLQGQSLQGQSLQGQSLQGQSLQGQSLQDPPAMAPQALTSQPPVPAAIIVDPSISVTHVALITFGILATLAGVFLAVNFPVLTATPQLVRYIDSDRMDIVVGAVDLPPGHYWESVDLKQPMLRTESDKPQQPVDPAKFEMKLKETGVWDRGRVPKSRKELFKGALPLLIALLGYFALIISVPAIISKTASGIWVWRIFLFSLLALFILWASKHGWIPDIDLIMPNAAPFFRASSLI